MKPLIPFDIVRLTLQTFRVSPIEKVLHPDNGRLSDMIFNKKKYCLKPKVLCQLFDTFVGSILNFASEVWSFGKCKEIERIHLKFCKTLLKVKSSTCNMGVYGKLGRYPLYISRYARIIKFWCQIHDSDNILINSLYDSLLAECSRGMNNWASRVKKLLDNYGVSYVWNNPFSVNLNGVAIYSQLSIAKKR